MAVLSAAFRTVVDIRAVLFGALVGALTILLLGWLLDDFDKATLAAAVGYVVGQLGLLWTTWTNRDRAEASS